MDFRNCGNAKIIRGTSMVHLHYSTCVTKILGVPHFLSRMFLDMQIGILSISVNASLTEKRGDLGNL